MTDIEWKQRRILITGSSGLVGAALRAALAARGAEVVGLDLRGPRAERGDVRSLDRVRAALETCDGVVHLAAVSRVVWAEREPEACRSTNVGGLKNVLSAARCRPRPPWLVFASSREVYGEAEALPVTEDTPLRPVNVYGRSKVEGERLVRAAGEAGLRAAIVRLSNVYGSVHDHVDRVVPAFARAAAQGTTLRVDGPDRSFDFTHVADTVRGLVALASALQRGAPPPPPIHLLTGRSTTLAELAGMAVHLARSAAGIEVGPPRTFDVARFHGSPERARQLLGWRPRVDLAHGVRRLIADFRRALGPALREGAAP